MRSGGFAAMAAILGIFAVATPSASRAETPEEIQRRLDQSRQKLDARRQAEQIISTDVTAMQLEREKLNQSLLETARLIQKSEAQLSAIEARQGELEAQEKLLRGSLAQRHTSILSLLSALQRMGHNPPPALITKREDALKMVRSAQMVARLFPGLQRQALELSSQLEELARVMADIKTEGDKLKAEVARHAEAQIRLSSLNEQRRQSLVERQADLDKVRREAEEIAKSVTDLSELIAQLDKRIMDRVGPGPAPPAETPADRRDIALAPQAPTGLARPPVAAPMPKPPERPAAIELVPRGPQVAALNPGRMKPAIPFVQAKGQLQIPAQGRRVLAFGDRTQNDGRSKGIVLETRPSGTVTAPSDGWVVYAGEFRSFGQLLIINADDGYHILLAGLSQIDVQLGEFVLAGWPVGTMAGAPKGSKAKGTDTAPVLYIEFRKDGTPINPDPWWIPESSKKVQG